MKNLFIHKLLVALTAMLALASVATAVDYTKANNTTALNLAGSWVSAATPPTINDLAIWDATFTTTPATIGGDLSLAGIKFNNPGANVQINGTSNLTLGASGIDLTANSGTRSLIIFPKIVLAANQSWTGSPLTISGGVDVAGYTLTLNSPATISTVGISGSGNIIKDVAGNLSFTSNGTFNGTLTINAGQVYFGQGGAAGSLGSGATITGGGTGGQLSIFRSNNFTLDNTITGLITFTKYGTGTTTLTGSNTFTRATSIQAGGLVVSSLNSVVGGTASSSLGAPTTVSNGTIGLGQTAGAATGQLTYTGAGETTDRVLNLQGATGGGVLDQSGTGLLKFTSNMTATGGGSKTLTLQGSTAGTGEIAGNIVNPAGFATSLTKTGTGTWTLSGANTYTGTTTVSTGTLLINNTVTAGNSGTGRGNVSVAAGTLGGTGILRPGSGNTITVSSGAFLAPGDSTTGNGIGALALDGGGTTGALLTLNSGAKMAFQLGSALASDKLNFWNYAGATDFVLNSNVIDLTFLAGSAPGTYNLFNFYSGNGTGLTASGISNGLSVNFLNGGAGTLDYSTTGQINLVVTSVPEPGTWALLAFSLTTVMVLRRRAS